jgi:catechol 2,3-dioxygenase-like lactoylglutathione lyase family enzyme
MLAAADRLLTQYESGRLSRRNLLRALALLAATPALASEPAAMFRGVELNHATLRTKDLARSTEFYQRLLGLKVMKEEKDLCYLDSGRGFLCLWQVGGLAPGCDHLCFGVEDFDRPKARATLERNGMNLRHDPDDPDTLYVLGPDEVPVQIEMKGYKG